MTQNFHGCEEILKKLRKGGEEKIEQRNETNIPKQCGQRISISPYSVQMRENLDTFHAVRGVAKTPANI